MLCDDIIREARRLRDRTPLTHYKKRIANIIEDGERFVIDNEAIDVILNVEESRPAALQSALNICRLPFPVLWVEFDLLYRMRQLVQYGYEPVLPKSLKQSQGGLLLIASDDSLQRGRVYSYSLDDFSSNITLNPVAMRFDFSNKHSFLSPTGEVSYEITMAPNFVMEVRQGFKTLVQNKYTSRLSSREILTLVSLETRFRGEVDYDASAYLEHMQNSVGRDGLEMFAAASMRDWGGDRRFIIGLLLMLNSRNLYETERFSVKRKNTNRSPRVRPDVVSHRTIKITLSKVAQNRANAAGVGSGQSLREHSVRGHWKVRAGGVFFWRPFRRGSGDAAPTSRTYRVVP